MSLLFLEYMFISSTLRPSLCWLLVISHGDSVRPNDTSTCNMNREASLPSYLVTLWYHCGGPSTLPDHHTSIIRAQRADTSWTWTSFKGGCVWVDKREADPQQTRDIEPLLVQCWPAVYDVGPTLNQQRFNVACLLGDMLPECELNLPACWRLANHLCSHRSVFYQFGTPLLQPGRQRDPI